MLLPLSQILLAHTIRTIATIFGMVKHLAEGQLGVGLTTLPSQQVGNSVPPNFLATPKFAHAVSHIASKFNLVL